MKLKPFKQGVLALAAAAVLSGCDTTTLKTIPSELGKTSSMAELKASLAKPGTVEFTKHLSANWAINLSGLLNLEHPKAVKAGLEDRQEPIEIYLYSLQHPTRGAFLVDSGVSEKLLPGSTESDLSYLVKMGMGTDAIKVNRTTKSISSELAGGVQGVFLTHIHIDHILGISDLPVGIEVFIGPGDARLNNLTNAAVQGSTDRLLVNAGVLREWQFEESEGEQASVIDIFGDGSVWAIHSPGHTPGTTAYLINSTEGPQLLTGDACHTRWGWEHQVEPGSFSVNPEQSVVSLNMLEGLVKAFPQITVHMGHQSLIE
ncbi:MAG: MBL fold metallo-hydrolase [Pseudomonadales bacterium]|nr:MBL fold metallo-hydrolase [Pseudomonadales bacterium]